MSAGKRGEFCRATLIYAGATWPCSRPRDHSEKETRAAKTVTHESLGVDHPADGRSYRIRWTEPEEIMRPADDDVSL